MGCAFIQVYCCTPTVNSPQFAITLSDTEHGKMVKVFDNIKKEGERAERPIIHEATHRMAPP